MRHRFYGIPFDAPEPEPEPELYKTCSKCGKEYVYPPAAFYRASSTHDGLSSACKACINQNNRTDATRNIRRINQNRRRARKAAAAGTFTADQWQARLDYYGGKCIYCGTDKNISIEHRIPLSRGGTNWASNLAPACRSCNSIKNTKTEKEFKALIASGKIAINSKPNKGKI